MSEQPPTSASAGGEGQLKDYVFNIITEDGDKVSVFAAGMQMVGHHLILYSAQGWLVDVFRNPRRCTPHYQDEGRA